MLGSIDDKVTKDEIAAERAFLDILGGGCSVPAGALARVQTEDNSKLTLSGCVAALDGSEIYRDSISGPREYAHLLGKALAKKIQDAGADKILEELRRSTPNVVSPP